MMPVIVIGADHPVGAAILEKLRHRAGEIRAFVSDETAAEALRPTEVKVAIGDLSDSSHIEGATMNCFCAVLVTAATGDGRELSFAAGAEEVFDGWRQALGASRVTRTIWVHDSERVAGSIADVTREVAVVTTAGRSPEEVAKEVAYLEDQARL